MREQPDGQVVTTGPQYRDTEFEGSYQVSADERSAMLNTAKWIQRAGIASIVSALAAPLALLNPSHPMRSDALPESVLAITILATALSLAYGITMAVLTLNAGRSLAKIKESGREFQAIGGSVARLLRLYKIQGILMLTALGALGLSMFIVIFATFAAVITG